MVTKRDFASTNELTGVENTAENVLFRSFDPYSFKVMNACFSSSHLGRKECVTLKSPGLGIKRTGCDRVTHLVQTTVYIQFLGGRLIY